jgi:hypothetical protein
LNNLLVLWEYLLKLVFIAAITAALPTLAAVSHPWLIRESFPGHIQPPWTKLYTRCEIWEERVVIKRLLADVETSEERPIKHFGGASKQLLALIEKARLGTYSETQGPSDFPFVNYFGASSEDPAKIVRLKTTSPETAITRVNESHEATSLRLLLDAHCGKVP